MQRIGKDPWVGGGGATGTLDDWACAIVLVEKK